VLVTGAGPIGLLAALLGRQRGLDVHVLDRVTEGPKPGLVTDLGAVYHHGTVEEACRETDVAIECTGVGDLVFDVMEHLAPNGILCLAGVSSGGRSIGVDAGALNRELVLGNDVIVGSVNANRRHYQQAAGALAQADHDWLSRLLTRPVPPERFQEALARGPGDVKVTVDFQR
jgi:threonine dehydrogenase-like Zn-dependent dehydrogenase